MDCTEQTCPASESIYGYRPSVPANAFFVAFFGTAAIIQTAQGFRYGKWTYCLTMVCGCITECIGHAGRIMLHDDPFGEAGFNLQICTLTLAPAFLAAAVYLMLKHLVLATSPALSYFPARYYTYIFITCDFISLVLQAGGGATAATVSSSGALDLSQLANGEHIMMAGLSFQVCTLLVFAALALSHLVRVRRAGPGALEPATAAVRASAPFRLFVAALALAFAAILARCVYRVAEMAGGWKSPIMQNEASFVVLDSALCSLATLALTAVHPGACFNYRVVNREELLLERERRRNKKEKKTEKCGSGDGGVPTTTKALSGDGSSSSDAELGKA